MTEELKQSDIVSCKRRKSWTSTRAQTTFHLRDPDHGRPASGIVGRRRTDPRPTWFGFDE
ncbi:hypothetical protein N7491_006706 [Penicillium cf. griseofulvum]|uniref:Uncharacterized protein n=1 Tax=Penicillium cf. griseofulvum TaxID=2972120 RepID=A0A9W9M0W3_9EURO|nr:hypothetical protein N7472_010266 [Penicillium cf. griseofulvum]KAJ5429690.1 hypothetical protein N7491_006706 [Penicillium cf. griseofulvum]KAJ5436543.1 hypothetical protein N7445_007428 [Penicillium cf. griseofulvum]